MIQRTCAIILWDQSQEKSRGSKHQPQPPQPPEEPAEPEEAHPPGEGDEKGRQEEVSVLKWAGFALIATALAVLPFAAWMSNRWAIVSATAGVAGIVLLAV